ncbi:hypothetical protein OFB78_30345, partial [Escherichia coli]|nr:hypothetical protein [Escherichia coli]
MVGYNEEQSGLTAGHKNAQPAALDYTVVGVAVVVLTDVVANPTGTAETLMDIAGMMLGTVESWREPCWRDYLCVGGSR